MTETTRSSECNACGDAVSGVRVGQYEVDVGVHDGAGAAATAAARSRPAIWRRCEREMLAAKARFGLPLDGAGAQLL